MPAAECLEAAAAVARLFDALEVPYFISGSLASSVFGILRSTNDADVVADLRIAHYLPFVAGLGSEFHFDEGRVKDAILRRGSFNLIHTGTAAKVDVFVLRDEAWRRLAMARRQRLELDAGGPMELDVATAEDIVLQKLAWYRLGNEVSERQWSDVQGVLKVQAKLLDLEYLRRWAPELGVADLLKRALAAAGLGP